MLLAGAEARRRCGEREMALETSVHSVHQQPGAALGEDAHIRAQAANSTSPGRGRSSFFGAGVRSSPQGMGETSCNWTELP